MGHFIKPGNFFVLLSIVSPLAISSFAASAPSLKVEEIDLNQANPTLVLPMRSQSLEENKKLPGFMLSDISATTQADYNLKCTLESSEAVRASTFPIRTSDIPEMNYPSNMMASPVVRSTSCSDATQAPAPQGFHQAVGQLTLNLQKFSSAEDADRRLYHLTLPIQVAGNWQAIDNAKQDYQQTCDRLKSNVGADANSVLFAYCVEPTITIQCCGNVQVVGEIDALVFAYANPIVETVTNTGKSILDVEVQNAKYLSDLVAQDSSSVAFSLCTEPSRYYALSSQCYALKQTYVPAHPDLVRCSATTTIDQLPATIWASHKVVNGKDTLRYAYKTSRMLSDDSIDMIYTASATGGELKTADGSISLVINGTNATLSGIQTKIKGAPAEISMQCQNF